MTTFTVFQSKEQATEYAKNKYGDDYLEFHIVNIIKIGSTIAKNLECQEGWAIDKEMDGDEE